LAIQVASGAGQQLLALIGDILDIARIESGQLSLAPQRPTCANWWLRCAGYSKAGAAKVPVMAHRAGGRRDVDVLIDPVRFKQVLSNLLSNAIKFTEQGEVSVRLSVRAMPLASVGVTVVIEDSGIGISEHDRQRLFSPFVQAGNPGSPRAVARGWAW
jgi:two-component system sensor histidine kinase EvgS